MNLPQERTMEYTIEALREPESGAPYWYILGSERTSGRAQERMNDYRHTFPKLPLRVVEAGTRKLVVLSDPRPVDAC
jgi:hypothetical protein